MSDSAAAPLDPTLALEHLPDALFLTDPTFRVTWINARATALLGYTLAEVQGHTIASYLEAAMVERPRLRQAELLAGELVTSSRLIRARDGRIMRGETYARRLPDGRFAFVIRDVTMRAEAEAALAQSEASFRALAEATPDAIAVHRGGVFVFCNRVFTSALGYAEAEIIGAPVLMIIHPESVAMVRQRVAAMQAGATELPWMVHKLVDRAGNVLQMEIAPRAIVFQGEQATVVVGRDLTEKMRMQARLAQADRLASIGTLAAGVGHELNNPLTYLLLNLDAAKAKIDAGAAGRDLGEQLAAVREAAQRMQDIVADLRRFARPNPTAPGRTDVNQAIDAALKLTGHELRLRAQVVRDLQATRPVLAGEGQLTQVLVNLLMNAAQALPEGRANAHQIGVRSWDAPTGVAVAVSDTGSGIPAGIVDRIFEPFFTTKAPSASAGTGLGLSICHGMITSLGGTIEVSSPPGAGTTFTVTLPAVGADAAGPSVARLLTPPMVPAPRPPGDRPRVLLIDDEPAIRSVLEQLLVEDYDVVVAESGRAAIALFEVDQAFAAIVCDMTMPDVSGPELWAWIEAHHPALLDRMLLMSGGTSAGGAALLQRHPDRWLHKPFSLDRLLRAVAARVAATRAAAHANLA